MCEGTVFNFVPEKIIEEEVSSTDSVAGYLIGSSRIVDGVQPSHDA